MKQYNWRTQIEFSAPSKNRLWSYMKMELDLFNHLNESMISQLRHGNFKSFKSLSKKLHIFGQISEHNIDIRNAIKTKEFPEALKLVKDDLTFLTEEELRILEIPIFKTDLSLRTKRNMAVQMFRYYCRQADAYTTTGDYLFAPKFLESNDLVKKRHVQLHRKAVVVENIVDKGKTITLLTIPYLDKKLAIGNNIKNGKWDMLFIHQKPGRIVNAGSPWFIDFRQTDVDYVLDYVDFQHRPHSSFNANRNDYRRTSF